MVRVGIVGLGFMGQMHLRCYQQLAGRAEVVAIADGDPKRAAGDFSGTSANLEGSANLSLDMTRVYGTTDYRQLLERPEVDLIDICVPTPAHPEVLAAAVRAGKHVLCEKPFALNSAAASEMVKACGNAKGYVMPAMCIRFWPQWRWLREAVRERRYGRVLSASFTRLASPPPGWYRDGNVSGGAVMDLHIHDADFVRYCFGDPKGVISRGHRGSTGAIDHVFTQYLFDDVPIVTAEGGWAMKDGFAFRMRYTVNFEKATADFDLARAEPLAVCQDGRSAPVDCGAGDGWLEEIRYFVECITNGTPPSVVTPADAASSIRLVEAEVRSVNEQRIVPFAPTD